LASDGGGMQGLSTLMILNDLMDAIAANDHNTAGKPRPCDVFDIIGGIGVGGWLALLLGRFHFDVPTCIKVYIRIVEAISPIKSWQKFRLMLSNGANFDQCKLIEEINLLAEKYKTGRMMMFQNAKGPRCQHA
jgi:patatin-like phospholipase/acyl hydrolase